MKGPHAVVTGGGSGIGAAIAKALSREGMQVTLMGHSLQRLKAIGWPAERCISVDVGDEGSVRAVGQIVAKTGRTPEQALAELAAANPQGRLVQPDEVANAVIWLCRRESSAITGQAIAVAGGEVM